MPAKTSPLRMLRNVGILVLGLAFVVGVFFLSSTIVKAAKTQAEVKQQIQQDLENAVDSIQSSVAPGKTDFVLVAGDADFATQTKVSQVSENTSTSIVRIKNNQAVDTIYVSSAKASPNVLTNGGDNGTLKGYVLTAYSISDVVKGYWYSYNSKTAAYTSGSINPDNFGSGKIYTQDATATVAQDSAGKYTLTLTATGVLPKEKVVKLAETTGLNGVSPAAFSKKASKLTAFDLPTQDVTFQSATGKSVALGTGKWKATYIVANSPFSSSIQYSTVLSSYDAKAFMSLMNGGTAHISYGGVDATLTFQQKVFVSTISTE